MTKAEAAAAQAGQKEKIRTRTRTCSRALSSSDAVKNMLKLDC